MRILKNVIALILIISLTTTSLNIIHFVTAESNNKDILYYKQRLNNNEDWEVIRSEIGLPYGVPRFSSNGFEFNFELWLDKQITVYGKYDSIENNDFTEGTQNQSVKAYYMKDGKKGEYRYHGFTVEGNKYTNINYINDMDSKRKAYKKKWIREPWENSKFDIDMSDYNREAIDGRYLDEKMQVRNWLKTDFLEFYTTEGIKATDHYNYFNVETPSGLINYGEAVGYHRTSDGREWYQTFSLPKATAKIATPVKASIEIMDLNYNLYNSSRPITFKGMSSVDIIVKVTSTLEDKNYYKDSQTRTMHYTRYDIENPIFKLVNQQGIFKNISYRKKQDTIDRSSEDLKFICYFKFTLEDNKQNRQNNTLSFNTNTSYIYVGNAGESELASASASVPIDWEDPIQSDFNINKNIKKLQDEYISIQDISYSDASFGQVDSYIYTIEDMQDLTHINDRYFATTVLDEERVNREVKELLNKYIQETGTYSFDITQQIYNETTDMYLLTKKTITLTIGEKLTPVNLDIKIPRHVLDIIPMKASEAYDNTPTESYKSRIITVDGKREDNFFNNYLWGDEADGLHKVEIKYISIDDIEMEYTAWVLVHDTKPQAHFDMIGTFKENRLLTVNNTSYYADYYVAELANQYEYKDKLKIDVEYYNYESPFLEFDTNTHNFMYKHNGFYQYSLKANNELRRNKGMENIEYNFNFYIQEDNAPAVTFNIWNSVLARNEDLMISFSAESLDGDNISIEKLDLYYDESNNQSFTHYEGEFTLEQLQNFKPTKLGNYKVVAFVKEGFGQPTMINKISDLDYKTTELVRYFYVDNYRPSTTLSVDIPMILPKVDVFVLTDESLNSTKTSSIKAESINNNNYLRKNNLIPTYNIWDLHTYTYSTNVSRSKTTGTRYPSSTISYNSNGYSGTLRRTSVSDNGKDVDFGGYETKTESKYFSGSHSNTGTINYDSEGKQIGSAKWSSPAPSSKRINSSGYSGTIPRIGTNNGTWTATAWHSNGKVKTKKATFVAIYGGTLRKSVTVWVSDYKWVSNYRGHYSGTVYKNEKQNYYSPFRVDAKRYMIYVTEGNIINIEDAGTVKNNNDVEIILIGNNTAKSQISHEHFIFNNGEDINSLVNKAMDWIIQQNPLDTEQFTVLAPFNFNMKSGNYDEEQDIITREEYLYVHNPNYYDNPTENEANSVRSYDTEVGWTSIVKNSFSKAGAYNVYRRIIDEATDDPRFIEFNKQSNEPYFQVYIHRKPLAIADMKWKYDINSNLYKLTFIDNSFDLDHQYTREDRGIEETMIRYKEVGSTEWNYKMPSDLTAGNYTIEYYVKDIEKVWSDAYSLDVTLNTVPTANITIESEIQFKEAIFRNENTIPAGETIQIVSPDKTTGAIIHSNVPLESAEVYVNDNKYSDLTLTLELSEAEYIYTTNIMEYSIPSNYADGNIDIRIKAISSVNGQYKENSHTVAVYTPIWEDYSKNKLTTITNPINTSTIMLSEDTSFSEKNNIKVITSRYTDKLKVAIDSIVFYIFKNGTVSLNPNNTDSVTELTNNDSTKRFKINNISVNNDSYKCQWNFDFYVVEGYPINNESIYNIYFYGYDISGNWSTSSNKHNLNPRSKQVNIITIKLYDFRATDIMDPTWKKVFRNSDMSLKGKNIYVSDMPIDNRNNSVYSNANIKKGYSVKFKISSRGLNGDNDSIKIIPKFYWWDGKTKNSMVEVDLYYQSKNNPLIKVGSTYDDFKIYYTGLNVEFLNKSINGQKIGYQIGTFKSIILDKGLRTSNGFEQIWEGCYYISSLTKAFPKYATPYPHKELKDGYIIINFSIEALKNGIVKFNYVPNQWVKEGGTKDSEFKHGDFVIFDNKGKGALDDYNSSTIMIGP